MSKSDTPVDDMEATMSMNSVKYPPMSFLLQPTLFVVMNVSLILAIWVRLTGAGWGIILWGIPLLLLAALHFGVQVTAIRRVPEVEPSYILSILLSNLFLFLGFTLQVDVGDTPEYYLALAVFYNKYLKGGYGNPVPDAQVSIYMLTSIGFLIGLIACWFLLLGKSFRKRENNV
jgi:hypothetical protein